MSDLPPIDLGNEPVGTPPTEAECAALCATIGAQRTPVFADLTGASISLLFAARPKSLTLPLSGDTIITASGMAQGRRLSLLIRPDTVDRALSWPAWQWLDDLPPTALAAGKIMHVVAECYGAGAASVVAKCTVSNLWDPDALAWITATEAADGQPLEPAVRAARNTLVMQAKAQGVWDPAGQLTITSGARTQAGGFVPLLGSPLTLVNFVSGDHSRLFGEQGDGVTKYLGGKGGHTYPQDDFSFFAYVSSPFTPSTSTLSGLCGNGGLTPGVKMIQLLDADKIRVLASNAELFVRIRSGAIQGLVGVSRGASSGFTLCCDSEEFAINLHSDGNAAEKMLYFARVNYYQFFSGRLSVFGFQHSTGLAAWGALLDQYHADLAAALA